MTAAKDVTVDDLEAVDEPEPRERYADEATRLAVEHDPDDPV